MAYTVLDSKNIDKKKNIYTFGGSGTKPERDDIAENSKLIDYSSGQKFYYDPTKSAGSKWQLDKEPSGGGGGSLPANFPAEGVSNANKFIGFDENGDYTAIDPDAPPAIEALLTFTVPQLTQDEGTYGGRLDLQSLTEEQIDTLTGFLGDDYTLFLNDANTPLERTQTLQREVIYSYNVNTAGGGAADPSKPFYLIVLQESVEGELSAVIFGSDTDMTGETVNIVGYETPEEPVSGTSFVVTVDDVDFENKTTGAPDKTIAEIGAAIEAGRPVEFRFLVPSEVEGEESEVIIPLSSAQKFGNIWLLIQCLFEFDADQKYSFVMVRDGVDDGYKLEVVEPESPIYDEQFFFGVDANDKITLTSNNNFIDILDKLCGDNKTIYAYGSINDNLTIGGDTVAVNAQFKAPLSISKMTVGSASTKYVCSMIFEGNLIASEVANTSNKIVFTLT